MISEALQEIIDLEDNYEAGEEAKADLIRSGIVTFTGQVAGAGKDTIKEGCAKAMGGSTLRSVTTREWRASDGMDYRYDSEEEFLELVKAQRLVEYAVLRMSYPYATDSLEIRTLLDKGEVPFKDLELKGLGRLREIAGPSGLIKAVYPLPDLQIVEGQKTGWEKMLTDRDYEGASFVEVLRGELGVEKAKDLRLRLEAARGQLDQVLETKLVSQLGTFFPVNLYGEPEKTIAEAVELLVGVKEDPIARFAYGNNVKTSLLGLQQLVDSVFAEASEV